MDTIIFHIDVNSAFLSWSATEKCRLDPDALDLRTVPSIIGGDRQSRHGIVLAKSNSAKKYGIVTGEPVAQALKKCPFLVIEPSNHALYSQCSKRFMDFLYTMTDQIEQVSVDECYMDFTGIAHQYASPLEAAAYIRNSIRDQLGFTVNVGISSNKLLAKMASDFQKPDRTHTLFPNEIQTKMWPLPVSELYMAGRSSVETLQKLGILTIGDLAKTDPDVLSIHLKSHGRKLWEYANGLDDSPVSTQPSAAKGIGNSVTLPKDITESTQAKLVLRQLSEKVGGRLRKANVCTQNISVEIKYATFTSVSHQMMLPTITNANETIYQAACTLFDQLWNHEPLRLLGIRATKLQTPNEPTQMSIFDLEQTVSNEKQEKLDQALDKIRKKYGSDVITRGSLLSPAEDDIH